MTEEEMEAKLEANLKAGLLEKQTEVNALRAELDQILLIKNPAIRLARLQEFERRSKASYLGFLTLKAIGQGLKESKAWTAFKRLFYEDDNPPAA